MCAHVCMFLKDSNLEVKSAVWGSLHLLHCHGHYLVASEHGTASVLSYSLEGF